MNHVIWAKVGSHPWWPARWGQDDEIEAARKSQGYNPDDPKSGKLVAFLGTNDYGVVRPDNIRPYEANYPSFSLRNKTQKFRLAMEEADSYILRLERPAGEGACMYCGNDSTRESQILVCDNCNNEAHMNCLKPPLKKIPKDEFFCPECIENAPVTVLFAKRKQRAKVNRAAARRAKKEKDSSSSSSSSSKVTVTIPKRKLKGQSRPYRKRKKKGSISFLARAMASNSNDSSESESYDQCTCCGDGGELILCDFNHCPMAYHSICLSQSGPKNSRKWFCPWHFCAVCGIKEKDDNLIRCVSCPLALCRSHAACRGPEDKIDLDKNGFFKCVNCCAENSKAELARTLFNLWSRTLRVWKQGWT